LERECKRKEKGKENEIGLLVKLQEFELGKSMGKMWLVD
jgi:hypothetical protein